jgi:hypothetical protein
MIETTLTMWNWSIRQQAGARFNNDGGSNEVLDCIAPNSQLLVIRKASFA